MRTIVFGSGVAFVLGILGCAGNARAVSAGSSGGSTAQVADGFDAGVQRDVETLRGATNKYHDLAAVEPDGYPTKLPMCISDSTMGGMGYHMIDRKAFDDKLEIGHPEMLIYAPAGEGKVELVAVEYAVPYRVHAATEKPPRLFGQELKRYDQFNYWALHVWAWRRNAAGLFADWNPAIKCS